MSAPAQIHWEADHFAELSEFGTDPATGHWLNDTCGPAAHEVCVAVCQQRTPTFANIAHLRDTDVAAGRWIFSPTGASEGQSVQQLYVSVKTLTPAIPVEQYPPVVDYTAPNFDAIHARLRQAMVDGQVAVMNLGNAQALPGNEANVHWHFVAVGGIDSTLGYLVANGDEAPFQGKPRWIPWPEIEQAMPVALVILTPPTTPTPSGLPLGVTDDGKALHFPGGFTMSEGFRQKWLDDPAALGLALSNGVDTRDGGSIQVCEQGTLRWDEKVVSVLANTPTLVQYVGKWQTLSAANLSLQAQHTSDQRQIQTYQQEVAAAQQKPALSAALVAAAKAVVAAAGS